MALSDTNFIAGSRKCKAVLREARDVITITFRRIDPRFGLPKQPYDNRSWRYSKRLIEETRRDSFALCYSTLREMNSRHNYNTTTFFFLRVMKTYSHSTVILREYFKNIPLKSCNIARIFIKLLERFLKCCRNLAMSAQNIINVMVLQYWYFILILS